MKKHKKMEEIIKIKETYGCVNLSSKRHINDLICLLKLPNSNHITLDITGCFTDYDSTSMLIDVILSHLDKMEGEKKLTVLCDDGYDNPFMYANLFLGSKFLNISDKFRLCKAEWDYLLNELKKKRKIEINIKIIQNANT